MSRNEEQAERQPYTQIINRYPVIRDRKQIAKLLKRWRKYGDRQAYDQLVYGNTKLIISIAKDFRGCGVPLSDLIQEGFFGLMKALEKLNLKKSSLATYASWWIWSTMLRLISDATAKRPYRLPSKIYQRVSLVARAINDFLKQHDRLPSDQEVHKQVHARDGTKDEKCDVKYMTLREVRVCLRLFAERYQSLDSPLPTKGDGKRGRFLSDVVADTEMSVAEIVERQHDIKKVEEEINKLEPRTRKIMQLRFHGEKTLAEIGERYGLSRERIRQIEKKALKEINIALEINTEPENK